MPQRVAVLLALAGTGETVCVGVCQRDRARPRVLPESMGRSAHAYAYEGHGRITVPYARPRMYGAACRERAHNACTRPGPHADANANSALVACLARVVFERARVACERGARARHVSEAGYGSQRMARRSAVSRCCPDLRRAGRLQSLFAWPVHLRTRTLPLPSAGLRMPPHTCNVNACRFRRLGVEKSEGEHGSSRRHAQGGSS